MLFLLNVKIWYPINIHINSKSKNKYTKYLNSGNRNKKSIHINKNEKMTPPNHISNLSCFVLKKIICLKQIKKLRNLNTRKNLNNFTSKNMNTNNNDCEHVFQSIKRVAGNRPVKYSFSINSKDPYRRKHLLSCFFI